MPDQLLTYKVFPDKGAADEYAAILESGGLKPLVEEDAYTFDASYANHPLNKEYRLKLPGSAFAEADRMLELHSSREIATVDADYYLLSFSDSELQEVLSKPDEWGRFDYTLARELLQKKGITYTDADLAELKERRLDELATPKSVGPLTLMAAYLIIPLLPVAFFLGWSWAHADKTLADGRRYYVYNSEARRHGRIIYVIVICLCIIILFMRIIKLSSKP